MHVEHGAIHHHHDECMHACNSPVDVEDGAVHLEALNLAGSGDGADLCQCRVLAPVPQDGCSGNGQRQQQRQTATTVKASAATAHANTAQKHQAARAHATGRSSRSRCCRHPHANSRMSSLKKALATVGMAVLVISSMNAYWSNLHPPPIMMMMMMMFMMRQQSRQAGKAGVQADGDAMITAAPPRRKRTRASAATATSTATTTRRHHPTTTHPASICWISRSARPCSLSERTASTAYDALTISLHPVAPS